MEGVAAGASASMGSGTIRMREKPPSPSYALNRKKIFLVIGLIFIVVGWVFFESLSKSKAVSETKKPRQINAVPGEAVNGLPNDYLAMMREEKVAVKPTVVVKAKDRGKNPEQEIIEAFKLKKLKNSLAAREADVSFKSVSFDGVGKVKGENFGSNSESVEQGGGLGASAQPNSRDDDNRQDDKNSFLNTKRLDGEILPQGVRSKLSDYQISAGTIISGVLLSGINSDLPGQILGQVSQDVYDSADGRYLLIPKGAKIIGQYDSRIVYGQERVLIVWTRILFPDGSSLNLEGMPGVDMSGYAGLSDQVNNHYLKLLTGVLFSSVLSAGAQMAQGPEYQTVNPEFSQLAAQGAAKEINEVGQQITKKNLGIQPTLEIRPGFRFNVFVSKDVVVREYGRES